MRRRIIVHVMDTHLDSRKFFRQMIEPLLRGQDTEKLDLVYWRMSRINAALQKGVNIRGIPQSVIMCNAAVAVPPVAIRGSSKKTKSIGGSAGNFE
jgi:hypothetical protein